MELKNIFEIDGEKPLDNIPSDGGYTNRFIAMPSGRNRVGGFLLYKYGINGFLHWGFNFYYSQNIFCITRPV